MISRAYSLFTLLFICSSTLFAASPEVVPVGPDDNVEFHNLAGSAVLIRIDHDGVASIEDMINLSDSEFDAIGTEVLNRFL